MSSALDTGSPWISRATSRVSFWDRRTHLVVLLTSMDRVGEAIGEKARMARLFRKKKGGNAKADRALTRVEHVDKGSSDVAAYVGHDGGAEFLVRANAVVGSADAGVLAFPDVQDEE